MSRSIGSVLDINALAALAQSANVERMRHFHILDRTQQAEAVRRLAATGMSEHGIAHATGLAVEQVRRALGDHGQTALMAASDVSHQGRP